MPQLSPHNKAGQALFSDQSSLFAKTGCSRTALLKTELMAIAVGIHSETHFLNPILESVNNFSKLVYRFEKQILFFKEKNTISIGIYQNLN